MYNLENVAVELAGLTLAILTVLVAGGRHSGVHAVVGAAVCGRAVGLG